MNSRSLLGCLGCLLFLGLPPAPAATALSDGEIHTIEKFVENYGIARQSLSQPVREELRRLSEGYEHFTRKRYRQAITLLQPPETSSRTVLADYFRYYSGLALFDLDQTETRLREFVRQFPESRLARQGALRLAEVEQRQKNFRAAITLLQPHAGSHNSKVLLGLARAHHGLEEYASAIRFLETLYFEYPLTGEAEQASHMLSALKQSGHYRAPVELARTLSRLETLLSGGRYPTVLEETRDLEHPTEEPDKSRVLVIKGRANYHTNRITAATRLFSQVAAQLPQHSAEAMGYLAASYRKLGRVDRFEATVESLRRFHLQRPETEEALFHLANHHWLEGKTEAALATYRYIAEHYPQGRYAEPSHWKVVWSAYQQRNYRLAADEAIAHLAQFTRSEFARPAIYWLGRSYLQVGQTPSALSVFLSLAGNGGSDYYGALALEALESLQAGDNGPAILDRDRYLGLQLAEILSSHQPQVRTFRAVDWRLDREYRRILELSAAGLPQLALDEISHLEQLDPKDGTIQLIKAFLYGETRDHWNAVKTLSRLIPHYAHLEHSQLPDQVWKLFYPLEYWESIKLYAGKHRIDPFLVAAIVRQESLFNPRARSRSNALGLMQILPSTGQELARRLRTPFSTSKLYDAQFNIRLGTRHLADLLKRFENRIPLVLAAYNGGGTRVSRWLGELPEDREEFVESIPLSETRDYVKRVVSHWNHYSKLYAE